MDGRTFLEEVRWSEKYPQTFWEVLECIGLEGAKVGELVIVGIWLAIDQIVDKSWWRNLLLGDVEIPLKSGTKRVRDLVPNWADRLRSNEKGLFLLLATRRQTEGGTNFTYLTIDTNAHLYEFQVVVDGLGAGEIRDWKEVPLEEVAAIMDSPVDFVKSARNLLLTLAPSEQPAKVQEVIQQLTAMARFLE